MRPATERPLSPHLQIYRWQLTAMVMSITHRFTGICLSLGAAVFAFWVIAAAMGETPFAAIDGHFRTWYGQALLVAWTFALFYHLCNGIRHLAWDTGWGLDLPTAYVTGYLTLIATAVLTGAVWWFALA